MASVSRAPWRRRTTPSSASVRPRARGDNPAWSSSRSASVRGSAKRPSMSQNSRSEASSSHASSNRCRSSRNWIATLRFGSSSRKRRSHTRCWVPISSDSARHEHRVVRRVPLCNDCLVGILCEPLGGKLADRLQHPEPIAGSSYETLVHERAEHVDPGVADDFRRLERAAADEHRKTCEERLLVPREEVVRPLDRRAQRLLPGIGVAAPSQHVQPLRQTLEQSAGDARPAPRRSGRRPARRAAASSPRYR